MNSDDLYTMFRSEMVDQEEPYLWSDPEVYGFVDSAQVNFCKLTGGLGDASSATAQIAMVDTTDWADKSPLVLQIRGAYRVPDGRPIAVINFEDMATKGIRFDGRVGPSTHMIVGMEANRVRFYPHPTENLTVQMVVDRLPLKTINDSGQRLEVADQHLDGLLLWMKHRAYSKQDAETFDKTKAAQFKADFELYCGSARAERARAMHKPRSIVYGGL